MRSFHPARALTTASALLTCILAVPAAVHAQSPAPAAAAHPRADARALMDQAALRRLHGDYLGAVTLSERALALGERAPGGDARAVAHLLGKLAEARLLSGDLAGAEADAARQLRILSAATPPGDPARADALGTLGVVALVRGDLAAADSLFRAGLALRRAALGSAHPDVAQMLANVAAVHLAREEYDRAAPLLQEAWSIYDRTPASDPDDYTNVELMLARAAAGIAQFARADSLFANAAVRVERVNGPAHPLLATVLVFRAGTRLRAASTDSVETWLRRALAIQRTRPAAEGPDLGGTLLLLGTLYRQRGELARADSALSEAVRTVEALRGAEDLQLGFLLAQRSHVQIERHDLEGAEASLRRSLAIVRNALPESPSVASLLSDLATVALERARYTAADSLLAQSLAIQQRTLGPNHPEVAATELNRANVRFSMGDLAAAERSARNAYAIYEHTFGLEHVQTSQPLNVLAQVRAQRGDYAVADSLLRRVLNAREKALGPSHPAVAATMNNLAGMLRLEGRYGEADTLFHAALAIRRSALGEAHPLVASTLANLALLAHDRGDYPAADSLYRQALAIEERALGLDHPSVATTLSNLAAFYDDRGDHARADSLLRRALAIREHALGPAHSETATTLLNLAVSTAARGDTTAAESLLARAATIYRAALGERSEGYATARGNLGQLYVGHGQPGRALPLLEEALRIHQGIGGERHPHATTALNNLAAGYRAAGRLADAEHAFRRVVEIEEQSLGERHPDFAAGMENLGLVLFAQGKTGEAIAVLERAEEARERSLQSVLEIGSEAQKTRYLRSLASELSAAASVDAELHSPASARLALTVALRRKGRALDAMSGQVQRLRRRLDPAGRALLDSLTVARERAARLATSLAGIPAADRRPLDFLSATADRLESAVSARSAAFRAGTKTVTVDAVQAALRPGAALIEWVRYTPAAHPGTAHEARAPRYAAYVLRRGLPPRSVELGSAAAADSAAERLREALGTPFSGDAREAARQLDAQVMAPVRRLLGAEETLYLSPAGALNLVPFAALVDEEGRYLLDRWTLVYLTSGRDLVRLPAEEGLTPGPSLVVGDPDYGEPGTVDWPRLAYTAGEADAVARRLSGAEVLLRGDAGEARVKAAARPRVLHLATHGFFRDGAGSGDPESVSGNPLLRAGVALAGANRGGIGDGEDGVLTALEVSGMDLDGTLLVVLSACETATGATSSGDGVFGLRRSLVLAGARTAMMGLWEVNERATRELVEAFYTNLAGGDGPARALRRAQASMRDSRGRAHPYYWAAFMVAGDERPLPTGTVQ